MLLFSFSSLIKSVIPFIGGAVFAVLVQMLIAFVNYRQQEKFRKIDDEQESRYNTVFGNEKPGLIDGETNLLMIEQLNRESENVTYGECGVGVFWKFDKSSKVLEIHGYGPMSPAMGYAKVFDNSAKDSYFKMEKLRHEAEKLIIFEGINYLENHTFEGFDKLEEVYIGPNIRKIPCACFKDCVKLKNVYLPYTLEEIQAEAFRNCTSLQDVSFPRSLQRIGMFAFFGCKNFKHLKCYCKDLRKIDGCAFSVSGLETIEIFQIGAIDNGAFSYTDNLDSVVITFYDYIEDEAFLFSGVKRITLTSGIYISENSFINCEKLEKLEFGVFEDGPDKGLSGRPFDYPIGLNKLIEKEKRQLFELPQHYRLYMIIKPCFIVMRVLGKAILNKERRKTRSR